MEDGDFDPFSDFAGNPSLPQYLENISQCHINQIPEEDAMDELLELQNSQAGERGDIPDLNFTNQSQSGDDIPDLNFTNQSQSGDEGQHISKKQRMQLTDDDRLAAYECLLQRSTDGKLQKGSTTAVSRAFNIPIRTVQRLWKRGKESGTHDISRNKVNTCGRKRVQVDWERIRNIPLRNRTTQRDLSTALGVSRRAVSSMLKCGEVRRNSNAIKPILTGANRQQRIRHCLWMIDPATTPYHQSFQHMTNVIHIDEKWFEMTKKTQTYYLLADEDDPVRKIKSSNFIPKVMFLAVVARPRYDCDGSFIFDGKIGIFPFVHEVVATRSSVNRSAGSLELKVIEKIDREVIRNFMINMVLPAIRDKWPRDSLGDTIIIQQDNAKPHILPDDLEFSMAASSLGLNVTLQFQPPNSPDLNVLDLGFFRAIQSLQQKECARSVLQLVTTVEKSFNEFSHKKCNYIFLTLQCCMGEILKILGSNTYKIPHMSKEYLERQGLLPSNISCDPIIIATARASLLP